MFCLSVLEEDVRVLPATFGKDLHAVLEEQLQLLFVDKVIGELGLVVAIYDILTMKGGILFPGEGASHYTVRFRVVVFRPFQGEVLVGKLKSCDPKGLRIGLDFFDDIYVSADQLQEPSEFDRSESLWVWKYEGNDLFMDLNQEVRFQVEAVEFPPLPTEVQKAKEETTREHQQQHSHHHHQQHTTTPCPGNTLNPANSSANEKSGSSSAVMIKDKMASYAPMVVHATIGADGLGLRSWWEDS